MDLTGESWGMCHVTPEPQSASVFAGEFFRWLPIKTVAPADGAKRERPRHRRWGPSLGRHPTQSQPTSIQPLLY
jgi:hypothetical protein